MRVVFAAACLALATAVTACGPRRVDVRTAPASQLAIQVTNNLSQPVNVYIAGTGSDTFLRQVRANSVETVPVQGVTAGTSVTIKAVTADGVHTYTRENVVLTGTYAFPVP